VSYRLIDHEPEARTDKVSAMRGHSVAEARLPLLARNGHPSPTAGCLLSGVKRKSASASSTSEFDPTRTSRRYLICRHGGYGHGRLGCQLTMPTARCIKLCNPAAALAACVSAPPFNSGC
jgi:hypothetical protein